MTYEMRATKIVVQEHGDSIYGVGATTIAIDDEGNGEFLAVYQGSNEIRINPDEWPTIRKAIDQMIKKCRSADGDQP